MNYTELFLAAVFLFAAYGALELEKLEFAIILGLIGLGILIKMSYGISVPVKSSSCADQPGMQCLQGQTGSVCVSNCCGKFATFGDTKIHYPRFACMSNDGKSFIESDAAGNCPTGAHGLISDDGSPFPNNPVKLTVDYGGGCVSHELSDDPDCSDFCNEAVLANNQPLNYFDYNNDCYSVGPKADGKVYAIKQHSAGCQMLAALNGGINCLSDGRTDCKEWAGYSNNPPCHMTAGVFQKTIPGSSSISQLAGFLSAMKVMGIAGGNKGNATAVFSNSKNMSKPLTVERLYKGGGQYGQPVESVFIPAGSTTHSYGSDPVTAGGNIVQALDAQGQQVIYGALLENKDNPQALTIYSVSVPGYTLSTPVNWPRYACVDDANEVQIQSGLAGQCFDKGLTPVPIFTSNNCSSEIFKEQANNSACVAGNTEIYGKTFRWPDHDGDEYLYYPIKDGGCTSQYFGSEKPKSPNKFTKDILLSYS